MTNQNCSGNSSVSVQNIEEKSVPKSFKSENLGPLYTMYLSACVFNSPCVMIGMKVFYVVSKVASIDQVIIYESSNILYFTNNLNVICFKVFDNQHVFSMWGPVIFFWENLEGGKSFKGNYKLL